jgi:DNA-binding beta-propeller fold protein YncE
MKLLDALITSALAVGLSVTSAAAQIAVSGNDGKQMRSDDDPAGVRPDTISVIDLNHYPPTILATINGPASMIGPPTAVAVAPDSSYALVTDAQKIDPGNPTHVIPNDIGSVIDLGDPRHPEIVQSFRAGLGAGGVTINKAGTLALVASTEDDAISVYSISHKRLTPIGKIHLAPKARPTDVIIEPNGREALAVERGGSKLEILSIDGAAVTDTGRSVYTGTQPYGAVITPDNRFAINTTRLGILPPEMADKGAHSTGAVTVVDLATDQLLNTTMVGDGPEHVTLTPDGKYLEVTVGNKANVPLTDPRYNAVHGLMHVYRVEGATLTEVATINTGHWCQGATWSNDDHTILLQCAAERDIEVYRFDGKTLTQDTTATLKFEARPGAIATANSR